MVAAGFDPKAEALEVAPPNAEAVVAAGFDPNAEALEVAPPNADAVVAADFDPNAEALDVVVAEDVADVGALAHAATGLGIVF